MRRSRVLFSALALSTLAACRPGEIVVTAEVEASDPSTGEMVPRAVGDVEVQILPYDRDEVFDSMAAAADNPEPPIPEDVLTAQNAIAEAQQQWRDLEDRWNTLRDSLTTLNETLSQYSRGEARYVALYREFQDLDGQYGRVERQKNAAFSRFDSLSQANLARAEEVRIQRTNWADEAFSGVDEVFRMRLRSSGLDMAVDTTDAQGTLSVEVKPGRYWVYARYERAYTELYWNVPVEVVGGETVQVRLSQDNAEVRPKL